MDKMVIKNFQKQSNYFHLFRKIIEKLYLQKFDYSLTDMALLHN